MPFQQIGIRCEQPLTIFAYHTHWPRSLHYTIIYLSFLHSAILSSGTESMPSCPFIAHFDYSPKQCTYGAILWLLHSWCNVKLLPSRHTICVHNTTMHQFTVNFSGSYIRSVHVRLAVTCLLHVWLNDRDLLRATAVTRGWNTYRNKSQQKG